MKKVLVPVHGFMMIEWALAVFGTKTGTSGLRAGGAADIEESIAVIKSSSGDSEEVCYG